jgi:hypothetical protein
VRLVNEGSPRPPRGFVPTMIDARTAVHGALRTAALAVVRIVAAALRVDEQAVYGRSDLRPARLCVVPDHVESTTNRTR